MALQVHFEHEESTVIKLARRQFWIWTRLVTSRNLVIELAGSKRVNDSKYYKKNENYSRRFVKRLFTWHERPSTFHEQEFHKFRSQTKKAIDSFFSRWIHCQKWHNNQTRIKLAWWFTTWILKPLIYSWLYFTT